MPGPDRSHFVADGNTRRIHLIRPGHSPGESPCLAGTDPSDVLPVGDGHDMKRMVELEAFHPCPDCMADYSWTE